MLKIKSRIRASTVEKGEALHVILLLLVLLAGPVRGRSPVMEVAGLHTPSNTVAWKRWLTGKVNDLRVGITEGLDRVRVSAETPAQVLAGSKTFRMEPGQIWTVRRVRGRAATVYHSAVLASFPIASRGKALQAAQEVRDSGLPATIIGASALPSTTLPLEGDTRRWYVTAGHRTDEAEARAWIARLKAKGRSAWLHTRLGRPPGGRMVLIDPSGREVMVAGSVRLTSAGLKQVHGVHHDPDFTAARLEDRKYRGNLAVLFDRDGKLAVVNSLPMEAYLLGVIPAEMSPKAPLEALKAQAICARSTVVSTLGYRRPGDPYDIRSDRYAQVYAGADKERPTTTRAVEETRGVVLTHENKVIKAIFGDTCGGITEATENIWMGRPVPYLKAVHDQPGVPRGPLPTLNGGLLATWLSRVPMGAYCRGTGERPNKYFRWTRTFTHAELAKAIPGARSLGRIRALVPGKRGASGRLMSLQVVGTKGRKTIRKELAIRRALGHLPSGCFVVRRTAKGFTFRGAGFGHGVGFCQKGAAGRARRGMKARAILEAYFPGVSVRRLFE